MQGYRHHSAPQAMLFGYDPVRDLPWDHLARLIERVVEETVRPTPKGTAGGQPAYDPRLTVKVLVYGYATGVRSSRRLEQYCRESLPFLFLTRGDTPSYRTLCTARVQEGAYLAAVWDGLFAVAAEAGIQRVGRITIDSTKLRADASAESVVRQADFAAVRAELARILEEAAVADAVESQETGGTTLQLGHTVPHEQMRDILRRVRRQRRSPDPGPAAGAPTGGDAARPGLPLVGVPEAAPPAAEAAPAQPMSPAMLRRVTQGLQALQDAEAAGLEYLTLTDPDARMMNGGVPRTTQECHSWEIGVDNALLVASETTQCGNDNERLEPLVAAAREREPQGVRAVDGDSGFYSGDVVGRLIASGLDLCIPDSNTAGDLHRGDPAGTVRAKTQGKIPFVYDPEADVYRCPEGNTLAVAQQRQKNGQWVKIYRAERDCTGCPLAPDCLVNAGAKRRQIQVGEYHETLIQAQERFNDPAHRERYRERGHAVETVFGFVRGTLGYTRWVLRGKQKVAAEAQLFTLAYQFRKIHTARQKGAA